MGTFSNRNTATKKESAGVISTVETSSGGKHESGQLEPRGAVQFSPAIGSTVYLKLGQEYLDSESLMSDEILKQSFDDAEAKGLIPYPTMGKAKFPVMSISESVTCGQFFVMHT
jgi:hypothetical protein